MLLHYWKWMWKKMDTLRYEVRKVRKIYTLESEHSFLSQTIDAKNNPDMNSKLGLHRTQPEFKSLVKNRVKYFNALRKLNELQSVMFLWEDIDMEIRDEDDHDTWNIKMNYSLRINKKNFFSYYPEYVKDVFGIN